MNHLSGTCLSRSIPGRKYYWQAQNDCRSNGSELVTFDSVASIELYQWTARDSSTPAGKCVRCVSFYVDAAMLCEEPFL